MFREFRYYLGEAVKSIWYNRIMALTSMVTVTGCLLLFGFFMLFGANINYISNQVMAQCQMQAFISKTSTNDDLMRIKGEIEKIENVAVVDVETQEQAFENCKKMLGKSADGLEDGTFLRPSCIVSLKKLDNAQQTAEQIAKVSGVEEVKNKQDIINNILNMSNGIKLGGIIAMIVLAVIAVFIISNTIKLAVAARSREIHIMKYVGATDWFIRWPFIIEGILIGIIGGAVSLAIILAGYNGAVAALTSFMDIFKLLSTGVIAGPLTLLLLLFGGFMGAIGSLIAVRRYLKV